MGRLKFYARRVVFLLLLPAVAIYGVQHLAAGVWEPRLHDVSNPDVTIEDLQNWVAPEVQVFVINIWADFCPICHREAPELEKAYKVLKAKYGPSFEMVAINVGQDSDKVVKRFADKYGLTFPMLSGAPRAPKVPVTFFNFRNPQTGMLQGVPEMVIEGGTTAQAIIDRVDAFYTPRE